MTEKLKDYWLRRAEETRALATDYQSPWSQQIISALALAFEELARVAERMDGALLENDTNHDDERRS